MNERTTRPAGGFSGWLQNVLAAISDDTSSDVPCEGCTACCTSAQFVHVAPDERDALDHIPRELLFPAPGLPEGYLLMGHDQLGRCPMLVGNRCSIYAHRPRTCRTYDCRVFAATGVGPGEGKNLLAARVGEWEFSHPLERDRVEHEAVRAAASYLQRRRGDFSPGAVPANPTQLAVLALECHDAFVTNPEPEPAAVRVAIHRRRPRPPEISTEESGQI